MIRHQSLLSWFKEKVDKAVVEVSILRVQHPSRHTGVPGSLQLLQDIPEAMRDVERAVRDEAPPPPLMREVSPDPVETRFQHYIKDFERCNLPMFMGRSDVMLVED